MITKVIGEYMLYVGSSLTVVVKENEIYYGINSDGPFSNSDRYPFITNIKYDHKRTDNPRVLVYEGYKLVGILNKKEIDVIYDELNHNINKSEDARELFMGGGEIELYGDYRIQWGRYNAIITDKSGDTYVCNRNIEQIGDAWNIVDIYQKKNYTEIVYNVDGINRYFAGYACSIETASEQVNKSLVADREMLEVIEKMTYKAVLM